MALHTETDALPLDFAAELEHVAVGVAYLGVAVVAHKIHAHGGLIVKIDAGAKEASSIAHMGERSHGNIRTYAERTEHHAPFAELGRIEAEDCSIAVVLVIITVIGHDIVPVVRLNAIPIG